MAQATLEEVKSAGSVGPEVDLRGIGRNYCQKIRLCPASQYLACGCTTQGHANAGKNCWELGGKPCCKRDDFPRCLTCEIFLEACDFVLQERNRTNA